MTAKLRAIRCTAFVTGMFLPLVAFAQAAAQPDSLVVAPVDSLVPAPVQAQTPQPVPTDSVAAPEPDRRASGKPTLRTGALTGLRLDGRLNEDAWRRLDSIADSVEPDEAALPGTVGCSRMRTSRGRRRARRHPHGMCRSARSSFRRNADPS
jgi:hypothetical protein